jgi:hypothetical protein
MTQLIERRSFLRGLFAMPAVVAVTSLMPIRGLTMPVKPTIIIPKQRKLWINSQSVSVLGTEEHVREMERTGRYTLFQLHPYQPECVPDWQRSAWETMVEGNAAIFRRLDRPLIIPTS